MEIQLSFNNYLSMFSLHISISGMKYFVTFIDCYTRMTWVYLLRHKDEVFQCFQDFCAYVNTQFKVQVQMIRSDNGTEYVNRRLGEIIIRERHHAPDRKSVV